MMKLIKVVLVALALLLVSSTNILASGFSIDKIGNSETGGRQPTKWWYTSLSPTLSGSATAGNTVTVDIDGTSSTVTADGSGAWSYTPSGLSEGDHTVTLTSNGSTISFTLSLGSNVDASAVASGSSETLPVTGTSWPTVALIAAGVTMIGLGRKFLFVRS